MATNKKLLEEKLDEWAKNQAKLNTALAKKNKELDPFIREHNEKVAPIIAKHDAKNNPLVEKNSALAKEIETLLLGNTDKDGNYKILSVDTATATAAISKRQGARIVQVKKFFDVVKDKTAAFWECLTVQVGQADKLLGKSEVDKISDKATFVSVNISLKK